MDGHARECGQHGSHVPRFDPRLKACLVPPDEVAAVWPEAVPHLAKALAVAGDYRPEDARQKLADLEWQLFIAALPGRIVSAALTEIHTYPLRKVLWVHAAGGLGEGVAIMMPMASAFARLQLCREIRFCGRRGWLRSGFAPNTARHVADVVKIEVR